MTRDLIIIGAAGLCAEISDTIAAINEREAAWNVRGVIDDDAAKKGSTCAGFPVIGGLEEIAQVDLAQTEFLIAFSSPTSFLKREGYVEALRRDHPNIKFATIIDPSAHISPSASIGEGSFIGPRAVIDTSATIGNHCIVLFFSVISRYVNVGDFTFVSASVNITGDKNIGKGCYLGVKTTVNANLADNILLSAGCLVTKDISARTIVFNRVQEESLGFETTDEMVATINML